MFTQVTSPSLGWYHVMFFVVCFLLLSVFKRSPVPTLPPDSSLEPAVPHLFSSPSSHLCFLPASGPSVGWAVTYWLAWTLVVSQKHHPAPGPLQVCPIEPLVPFSSRMEFLAQNLRALLLCPLPLQPQGDVTKEGS